MIKTSIKFILIVLLSNLLILTNSFSFHKETSEKPLEIPIKPDDDKKLLIQKEKKNYCTQKILAKKKNQKKLMKKKMRILNLKTI